MGICNSNPVDEYELNHKDSVVFKVNQLSLSQRSSTVSVISDKNRGSTSTNSQVQLIHANSNASTVDSPSTSVNTSPKHFHHKPNNYNDKNRMSPKKKKIKESNKQKENNKDILPNTAYKWERRSSDSILKEMSSVDDNYKILEKQKSNGQLGLPNNSRMNSTSLSFLQSKNSTPRTISLSSLPDTNHLPSSDVMAMQRRLDQLWNETMEPKRTFSDVSILSTTSRTDDFISPPISRKNSRLNLNLIDRRDSLDDSLVLWPHERVNYQNNSTPLRLVSFDVDKGKLDQISETGKKKSTKKSTKIKKTKKKEKKKKKINNKNNNNNNTKPKIQRKRSLSVDHTPFGNDIVSKVNNNSTKNGSQTARVSNKRVHKRSASVKGGRFNSRRSSKFKHVKSVIDMGRGRKKSKRK